MANHKSSVKRVRQEENRRLRNRYYGKTMRDAIRRLRSATDKVETITIYPSITKMVDKLAKTSVTHKNKVSSSKFKLAIYINKPAQEIRPTTDSIQYQGLNFLVRPFMFETTPPGLL